MPSVVRTTRPRLVSRSGGSGCSPGRGGRALVRRAGAGRLPYADLGSIRAAALPARDEPDLRPEAERPLAERPSGGRPAAEYPTAFSRQAMPGISMTAAYPGPPVPATRRP